MVPLAEAWRSGADTWTADQRRDFGSDLKDPQLLIASESSGRLRLVACWPRLRILLCAEGALTVTVLTPTGLACVQGWAPPGRRSPLHGMCEGLFRAQARWAHHAQ